jgi:2-polyprenyl-3-methyl-5-hydroxy-6-metoxy-1,4-benzoquinol methylase
VKKNLTTPPNFYDSCPLCESHEIRPRWEVNGYPIVSCDGCSLVFVQKKVGAEELATHYAAVDDPSYDDSNLESLNYYYGNLAKIIRDFRPQPGTLLDVGCSGGWFFDSIKPWQCYGNEITQSYGGVARQRYGDRIFLGSFEDYPLRPEFFDVITLQDVFDHMPDPIATLGKCHSMLKPAGLIVVKVHNIACLYAKLFGRYFYALVPPSHLFYYNRETLRMILAKTGFRMIDSRFMPHLLSIQTALLRLAKNDPQSWGYRLYRAAEGTRLGRIKIKKNLHDVITVLAVRE